jgi:diguanylate cyclase (GGDEF)-like protein/PAS domain S-box-containing protein
VLADRLTPSHRVSDPTRVPSTPLPSEEQSGRGCVLGSLRGRFILSYVVLWVVLAAMLIVIQENGTTAREQFKGTLATDSRLTIDLGRQIRSVDAEEKDVETYLLTGDPAARRQYLHLQSSLLGLRHAAQQDARGRHGVQRSLATLAAREDAWSAWAHDVVPPASSRSRAAVLRTGDQLSREVDAAIQATQGAVSTDEHHQVTATLSILDRLKLFIVLVLAAGVCVITVVSLFILRGLRRPLRLMERSAETIGAGDLAAPVPRVGAEEFRALATRMDTMRLQLQADRTSREQAEEQLRFQASVLDSIGQAVVATDADGTITYWNAASGQLYGWDADEALGRNIYEVLPTDASREQSDDIRNSLQSGRTWTGEFSVRRRDGAMVPAFASTTPVIGDDGRLAGMIGVTADISELVEGAVARRQLAAIVESSQDAIFSTTLDGSVTTWNPAAEALFGYAPEEIIGKSVSLLVPEGRLTETDDILRQVRDGESVGEMRTVRLRKNGEPLHVSVSVSPILDHAGRVISTSAIVRDVRERVDYERRLQHQAMHDPLTGLPNRVLFNDRLHAALAGAAREDDRVTVLMIDLDGFKEINDTLGHTAGDTLLQQVSTRFRSALRDTDTVARLGGDEFAVLLPATPAEYAWAATTKLLGVLTEPVQVGEHDVFVNASIGIAGFPDHGDDPATLMRRADVAMYRAKRTAGGAAVYEEASDPYSTRRLALIAGLRTAIDNDELMLHYQPKVDLRTGAAAQAEALARWDRPGEGIVPPDEFVPLAEQTGLIKPLTRWVLRAAVRQMAAWAHCGIDIAVAVNLSTWNFQERDLVATVQSLLEEFDVDPKSLTLEITESALMLDPERGMLTVTKLQEAGVRVSIDDFGTGYSSLAYLRQLPVRELKIDRSFIADLSDGGSATRALVETIVRLGKTLDLTVVAEGAETQAEVDVLTTLGCDQAQGYVFSRPVSAEVLVDWLRKRAT